MRAPLDCLDLSSLLLCLLLYHVCSVICLSSALLYVLVLVERVGVGVDRLFILGGSMTQCLEMAYSTVEEGVSEK
jgi:hypothetical protein